MNTKRHFPKLTLLCSLLAVVSCGPADSGEQSDAELMERARGIHDRVITLDTHNDISSANFTEERNYTMDLPTQVNLPKMEAGGLDVTWLVVFVGQGPLTDAGYAAATQAAMDKFNAIHWLAEEKAPDQIEIAYTSDDVRSIVASGKKVAMIAIENAYQVGLDLDNIRRFQELGGRYMSLAHNGHSQFSDSNTGERDDVWLYNGLSDLGRQAVAEMNKWGIMIDISHPSKPAIMEMLELSQAPIMASHSAARSLGDVSRNLDDEQLMALKANGGVVQTVALRSYVDPVKNAANREAQDALYGEIASGMGFEILDRRAVRDLSMEDRATYDAKMDELQEMAAPRMEAEVTSVAPPVDVADFVDHIDYMVELIGIEHFGISSDFDGGGGVTGWDSAAETFNVTLELVRRGYTEEQIGMLWSGNLLRVLDEVQAVAQELQNAS